MKFFTFILFIHTFLFANIDINNKAITIGSSSSLAQSKNVANELNAYDVYIYKTFHSKKPYYYIYVVNIKKENHENTLKAIRKKYHDVYFTSEEDIKQLALVNFDNYIFIKSTVKRFYKTNKHFVDTNINLNKKSLFMTNVKNKKELFFVLKKYQEYDLFVEKLKINDLNDYENCCSIYIVNIPVENFNSVFSTIRSIYRDTKEIQSTLLKYTHERDELNKFIKRRAVKYH